MLEPMFSDHVPPMLPLLVDLGDVESFVLMLLSGGSSGNDLSKFIAAAQQKHVILTSSLLRAASVSLLISMPCLSWLFVCFSAGQFATGEGIGEQTSFRAQFSRIGHKCSIGG